jgi:hypothetical protein
VLLPDLHWQQALLLPLPRGGTWRPVLAACPASPELEEPPELLPVDPAETLDEEELGSGKLKKATAEGQLSRAVKKTGVSIAEPEETDASMHAGYGAGRGLQPRSSMARRHGLCVASVAIKFFFP